MMLSVPYYLLGFHPTPISRCLSKIHQWWW